jgi:hypothetical protein
MQYNEHIKSRGAMRDSEIQIWQTTPPTTEKEDGRKRGRNGVTAGRWKTECEKREYRKKSRRIRKVASSIARMLQKRELGQKSEKSRSQVASLTKMPRKNENLERAQGKGDAKLSKVRISTEKREKLDIGGCSWQNGSQLRI